MVFFLLIIISYLIILNCEFASEGLMMVDKESRVIVPVVILRQKNFCSLHLCEARRVHSAKCVRIHPPGNYRIEVRLADVGHLGSANVLAMSISRFCTNLHGMEVCWIEPHLNLWRIGKIKSLAHIRETEHRFPLLVQRNSQLPKLTVTENLYFHTVIEKFINIPFWNYCFLFSRCKVKARKWGESCTTTVLQPKKIGATVQSMETVAPKKVHLPL